MMISKLAFYISVIFFFSNHYMYGNDDMINNHFALTVILGLISSVSNSNSRR
jgi:hypothetical protein